jgi:hypothetical protein
MIESPSPSVFPLLYTGKSPFLKANRFFVQALLNASHHCRIESTEDILDQRGAKLWARDQPIVPELLQKLADRELRKPIELCVRAKDPVSEAAIEKTLMELCQQWPDLHTILKPHLTALHKVLAHWKPNPQQLLSISVLRHGGTDRFPHAVAVAALALTLAEELGTHQERQHNLLLAGLLHDVGLLYYELVTSPADDPDNVNQHPMVGALAAIELTHCSAEVGHLILSSHERINGTGYPRQLKADQLTGDARILLFAEAITPHLMTPGQNVWSAAVTARLIPGEFDAAMVSWMAKQAQVVAALLKHKLAEFRPQQDAGESLRELHGKLARIMVLIAMSMGESDSVREALLQWQKMFAPLVTALRSSGVEEALTLGQTMVPQSDEEAIELHALLQELELRLASAARLIQERRRAQPEFQASWLVGELLRILQPIPVKGE